MYYLNEWCNRLIAHEGMVLKPYKCPRGKLTIGVGRNLDDNPLSSEELRALGDYKHGITENGAKMLLRNDIMRCFEQLNKHIKGFEDLSPDRQYALLDMCFQLGFKGLKKFRNMIKAIEKQDFIWASFECLASTYAKQVPSRSRRVARALKTGKWFNG